MATVVICGNGETGAAIAHALLDAGHGVVVQRDRRDVRDAGIDMRLGGVLAKQVRRIEDLKWMLGCGRAVPVADEPLQQVVDAVQADLVLDTRTLPAGAPNLVAEAVLRDIAARGLSAKDKKSAPATRAWKPFGIGALIGYVGGLIGLGGAEFRLPALVGWFELRLRTAIIANLMISLATVVSALITRASFQDSGALAGYAVPTASLAIGSIAGAYAGAGVAARVRRAMLHRLVGSLLVVLAAVMAMHGLLLALPSVSLTGAAGIAAGIIAGSLIGIVSSLLGVAGGELLIPTLVLLFGADIKLAGTLSLAVSVPTIIVALARLRATPAWHEALGRRGLVLWMAAGSIVGAVLGSFSFGSVPTGVLGLLLAAILLASGIKLFRG